MSSPPEFLPFSRANTVRRKLRASFARPNATVCFSPSYETDFIDYFPAELDAALRLVSYPGVALTAASPGLDQDVVIVTAHGSDVSSNLWGLRLGGFAGIIAVWAHDNHLASANNLSTAVAADVVFPSHGPFVSALTNPISIRTAPVHLCAAQWTVADSARLFERFGAGPRGDRLFAPYVDYPFREHASLLHMLRREMPEAEVLLMPPDDRARYFGQKRDDRFAEWASRKVSLVLPMARDLSLRLFDALLAGQTLIAPLDLPDLDVVIPPERQRELGVVRFARYDVAAIGEAWREALAAFDAGGLAGARRRHEFVRGAHMLEHRVLAMVEKLRRLADGTLPVRFGREPEGRAGLIADGN